MTERLLFDSAQAARDVVTFAERAAHVGDGNVRLRAAGGLLTVSAAPLAPQTLLDATPTVLGMRVAAVDPELVCDLVVDATGLAVSGTAVTLPETGTTASWAGISPPRGGWEAVAEIPASLLASRAQAGMAEVAEALPASPGEEVVQRVRADVWGRPDPALGGLAHGIAFAAFALGFIGGDEPATVRRSGPWTRVSLTRGHVLTRVSVREGLTTVMPTGRTRP
ncbi:hypothetical protein [Microbacterium sp. No. 7]|uniref:hypothetical protein n=1 Tax=Microbacterium sp. No. 7 TaxID=1714373 RepID=UPI0006D0CD44|nr:hypothetical protein [Microbacterium sp. No. 7]ALJ20267.1 hypothetical protein AOA12_10215 [Microbacterium sp. No. 7]